jgi:predicted RNA binding protein YcfA (HicA-like mRNA interferase family)
MTPRLPARTPKQVMRLLEEHGFVLHNITGSHHAFFNPSTKKRVTVPFHRRDIPKGTLAAILKQAGIDKNTL